MNFSNFFKVASTIYPPLLAIVNFTNSFSIVVSPTFADGSVAEYAKFPKVFCNWANCVESPVAATVTVALSTVLASNSFALASLIDNSFFAFSAATTFGSG